MTVVLEELAARLEANGIATRGVDLFLHVAPDKPDEIMTLVDYTADAPEWVQDNGKVDHENVRVQLGCRAVRPEVCRLWAERAYQVLMQIHNETISGTRIFWCAPVDAPSMIGRDENGRFLTTVNFRIAKELSSV